MTAMLIHSMAPIMFTSLVVFLLLGYPVAFSLAANGLIFGLLGIELGLFRPDFLQALPERIYGIMNNDILLAIPFFTFMGLILERSGMAEDLLDTIGQLFGTVRGGLAYAVVFVAALLLRSASGLGRDRGLRNARADHPAIAGAHRDGRPARPLGRRHVRGRIPSGPHVGGPLRRLRAAGDAAVSQIRPGPAVGGDRIPRRRRQTRPHLACGAVRRQRHCRRACDAKLYHARCGLRRARDVYRHRLRFLRRGGELGLRQGVEDPFTVSPCTTSHIL